MRANIKDEIKQNYEKEVERIKALKGQNVLESEIKEEQRKLKNSKYDKLYNVSAHLLIY